MEAYFTGPSKNVNKIIPEKVVNKDGFFFLFFFFPFSFQMISLQQKNSYFVVPFQTDVPGIWRGMVRFNGVNVQPRSAKLKVLSPFLFFLFVFCFFPFLVLVIKKSKI